jgi:Icc-related predicted phosphoesterase
LDPYPKSLSSPIKTNIAHTGSEALLRYVKERQPRYVYHGHVHSAIGTMIGKSAVVSVFGAKIFTLS